MPPPIGGGGKERQSREGKGPVPRTGQGGCQPDSSIADFVATQNPY